MIRRGRPHTCNATRPSNPPPPPTKPLPPKKAVNPHKLASAEKRVGELEAALAALDRELAN
ncbi:hypothetical protein EIJ50_20115, partial [Xanthomonas perforans]